MPKFNKSSNDKSSSFKPKTDRKPRKPFIKGENTATDDTASAKKGYKAKRSFTKNKDFRTTNPKTFGDKPRRSFGSDDKKTYDRPYKKTYGSDDKKPFKKDFGDKPYKKTYVEDGDKKPFKKEFGDKPRRTFSSDDKKSFDKPYKKSFEADDKKPFKKDFADKPRKSFDSDDKPYKKAFNSDDKKSPDSYRDKKDFGDKKPFSKKPFAKDSNKPQRKHKPHGDELLEQNKRVKFDDFTDGKAFTKTFKKTEDENSFTIPKAFRTNPSIKRNAENKDGLIRLNKYLSNAGIASRRDADTLIASGVVKVNGVPITEMGYKVKPGDTVTYGDSKIKSERKVYLLLNKPKDYITTTDDPQERHTVMELIAGACKERLYPVGRLDRNTTGLLLFTNDGELTDKLTHPKHNVKKVYHVTLNKGLKPADFTAITEGIKLEDGLVKADDLAFVGEGKKDVGIEIHSGKNRIVRRIFEHLGYEVEKLDRVVFAGLTKKTSPAHHLRAAP
jgi:23S rRNA pseudouridine2605 synthase